MNDHAGERSDHATYVAAAAIGRARGLLLTILAELVLPGGVNVWMASLLQVLRGLGLEDQAARQTVARASTAGWLRGNRYGRQVLLTLTREGRQLAGARARQLAELGAREASWDGRWAMLAISVPQDRKSVRTQLYTGLNWLGFGSPVSGVWVTPRPAAVTGARAIIDSLRLRQSAACFLGNTLSLGLSDSEIVRRAWDLGSAATQYRALLADFGTERAAREEDQLFRYLALIDQWRALLRLDPGLPASLTPGWSGSEAASALMVRRRLWAPVAHAHWTRIVQESTPDHAIDADL